MHRILRAAVAAVDPSHLVADALDSSPLDFANRPAVLIAAGKAARTMASAFAVRARVEIIAGLAAGPGGPQGDLPAPLEAIDCGHPLPDAGSERAGRRALALASARSSSTLVVLLSGGASAMLAVPAAGIALADKVTTTRALLRAGCAIDEVNCVRKHLSAIKGGQLAAAAPRSLTLAISDVHGPVPDDPSVIGSGPTVADPTTYSDALAIVAAAAEKGFAGIPPSVVERFRRGARGEIAETPKPGDPRLSSSIFRVIGNRTTAMQSAARAARQLGYDVQVVAEPTVGEARLAGEAFARAAIDRVAGPVPVCVVASGETTVTVRGDGRGGRNQEFALGAARVIAARGEPQRAALIAASVGTDGIDGPTDAAGALVDSSTLARAAGAGLDADAALARNDTYAFFQRLGDLIVWGPTGTNVGDLHVMVSGKW